MHNYRQEVFHGVLCGMMKKGISKYQYGGYIIHIGGQIEKRIPILSCTNPSSPLKRCCGSDGVVNVTIEDIDPFILGDMISSLHDGNEKIKYHYPCWTDSCASAIVAQEYDQAKENWHMEKLSKRLSPYVNLQIRDGAKFDWKEPEKIEFYIEEMKKTSNDTSTTDKFAEKFSNTKIGKCLRGCKPRPPIYLRIDRESTI